MEKQHKYNVGDEITVKIAAVTENNGKPAYRIKGIENIKFSEGGIESMDQKKIKPGDKAYSVMVEHYEEKVYFECYKIEDVGTKEIKIKDDWFDINDMDTFYDEKEAEAQAIALAKEHGYQIVKGGLLREERTDGN